MYVFDTNILVAALRSRNGPSNFLLTEVVEGRLPGLVSTTLMLEYEAVLKRADIGIFATPVQVDRLLDVLAMRMDHVTVNFRWRPVLDDPGDDLVLECAMNGNAHAIITSNVRDFREAKVRGMAIRTPGAFAAFWRALG